MMLWSVIVLRDIFEKMAGDGGLNALSLSAGKCAAPMAAENCANAQKILRVEMWREVER